MVDQGAECSPSPPQGDSSAKGWDVIQAKMLTHDEDMIRYFTDDIDNLLVFVSIDGPFVYLIH